MLFIEPQAPIATVVYPCTLKDVHSASCIDNIIVSKLIPTIHSGIIIEDVSDHFPVFYCFSEQTQKNQTLPHRPRLAHRSQIFPRKMLINLRIN